MPCEFCQTKIVPNKLECNHIICKNCLRYRLCPLCYPEYSCKNCKTIDNVNIISCKHSFCLNCRKKNLCNNCCSICLAEDTMENGNCLKCIEGRCEICMFFCKVQFNTVYE